MISLAVRLDCLSLGRLDVAARALGMPRYGALRAAIDRGVREIVADFDARPRFEQHSGHVSTQVRATEPSKARLVVTFYGDGAVTRASDLQTIIDVMRETL
jgi:hypothetical protein